MSLELTSFFSAGSLIVPADVTKQAQVDSFFSANSLLVLASATALVLLITQGIRLLFKTGMRVTLFLCYFLSLAVVLATTSWTDNLVTDLLIMLGNSFLLFLSVIGSAQFVSGPTATDSPVPPVPPAGFAGVRRKLIQPFF